LDTYRGGRAFALPPFSIVCEITMNIMTEILICLNLTAAFVYICLLIKEKRVIAEEVKERKYQENLVQIGGIADIYGLEEE